MDQLFYVHATGRNMNRTAGQTDNLNEAHSGFCGYEQYLIRILIVHNPHTHKNMDDDAALWTYITFFELESW